MHENHRERVRQRFFENGIENMSERAVLEMLLFYCIPRKDTNAIAGELLESFGSLTAVFEAPVSKLRAFNGIGDSAAAFLSLIPLVCRRYLAGRYSESLCIDNVTGIEEYIKSIFIGADSELFYMLCFDRSGRLVKLGKTSCGDSETVNADKQELLAQALFNGTQNVIFAHNHPDGVASPSRDDIYATQQLVKLFEENKITVCDHYISSGSELLSMASCEKFKGLFLNG